jgi:hypothetical protein
LAAQELLEGVVGYVAAPGTHKAGHGVSSGYHYIIICIIWSERWIGSEVFDQASKQYTLADGEIFTHIGVDHVFDTCIKAYLFGHSPVGFQCEQYLCARVTELVVYLFFSRKWTVEDDNASSFQRPIKGNHTLRNIGQHNRDTISSLHTKFSQGVGETVAQ